MKTRNKVMMLTLATAAFSVGGLIALPKTVANANTTEPAFYMEAGAAVNITDETYGGIRWTTVIEEGYVPVSGAEVANVSFGTFVVPTKTYESATAGTEIKDMADVVNVQSDVTGTDALNGDVQYHSAIKYDDIIADYMQDNNLSSLTPAEETELLTKAYQMELTAVSYAFYDNTYYYATAVETSRSARQVANIAILSKDLEKEEAGVEKTAQIKSYVETGADEFARTQLDNASEGYLDLTELAATEVTAQPITVSGLTGVNFETDVAEILIGANKLTADDYTYADGTLSLTKASACLEAGKETWLSIFTKDGNVHSLPVIPADGVIRSVQDLNDTFGMNNPKAYGVCQVCGEEKADCACDSYTDWNEPSLFGYYVLGNDLNATTEGVNHKNDGNNGDNSGIGTILDITGGFRGTFDGRGYSISNVKFQARGLFGWTVDATIKNVAFLNTTLNTQTACMVLAGRMYNTCVENVYIDLNNVNKNGGAIFNIARSCMFKNCIFDVDCGEYDRSSVSNATQTWSNSTYPGEYNTFENAYVISTDFLYKSTSAAYDAQNWDVTGSTTTINVKSGEIKRYLNMTDMFDNVYYNADGSVNESATKSNNDWTAFENSGYWTVDTANKTISWK